MDVPDVRGRIEMIKMNLKGSNVGMSKGEFDELGKMTEGYSNADLKSLTKEAAMGVVAEIMQGDLMKVQAGDLRPIKIGDFRRAVKVIQPSVKPSTIAFLRGWAKK